MKDGEKSIRSDHRVVEATQGRDWIEATDRQRLDRKDSLFEILRFFTSLEASLSMDLDEGSDVDLQLLEDVSNATDEFNLPEGKGIDIDDLNLRLMNSE